MFISKFLQNHLYDRKSDSIEELKHQFPSLFEKKLNRFYKRKKGKKKKIVIRIDEDNILFNICIFHLKGFFFFFSGSE